MADLNTVYQVTAEGGADANGQHYNKGDRFQLQAGHENEKFNQDAVRVFNEAEATPEETPRKK